MMLNRVSYYMYAVATITLRYEPLLLPRKLAVPRHPGAGIY